MPPTRDYVAEAIELGVDGAMIEALVRRFYEAVRRDDLIGPVFETRIAEWEPHLQRMCAFWGSVMLRAGGYHGQPMPMHAPLPVEAAHFDRWLALFAEAARDTCGPAADIFTERAQRIAQSLEFGIATWRSLLLAPGERLPPLQADEQGPVVHDSKDLNQQSM
jgi:hemoglobin